MDEMEDDEEEGDEEDDDEEEGEDEKKKPAPEKKPAAEKNGSDKKPAAPVNINSLTIWNPGTFEPQSLDCTGILRLQKRGLLSGF